MQHTPVHMLAPARMLNAPFCGLIGVTDGTG